MSPYIYIIINMHAEPSQTDLKKHVWKCEGISALLLWLFYACTTHCGLRDRYQVQVFAHRKRSHKVFPSCSVTQIRNKT